jgi:CheY-like chemotaxis protein
VFTFTVGTGPLAGIPLTAGDAPAQASAAPPPRITGRRILVVDDRRDMRYLIQAYLEEAGAEVRTASDGRAALEAVTRARESGDDFHAVVLDMQMPVMDGYHAAKELRGAGYSGSIVALTASAMRGDRERCLEAGCDDYLPKPVDRLKLLAILGRSGGDRPSQTGNGDGASRRPEPKEATDGSRRVLIVEDGEDAAESLAIFLESYGHSVTTALSGQSAVERAATLNPEVVLMDLGLPDMDGYQTLERLKQVPQLAATRFIALSGRGEPEDIARTRAAGFHHHIVKPADLDTILRLISSGPTPAQPPG